MKKKLPINPKTFEIETPRALYPRTEQKLKKDVIVESNRNSILDII